MAHHAGFDADQDCSHVAAAAVAKGIEFIARYLKNLFAPEVAALHAAGLGIILIFETTATRALGGAAAGTVDGTKAMTQAKALGAPMGAGVAIYATCDWDVTPAQQNIVAAYLEAFAVAVTHGYSMGVYANGAICQLALDQDIAFTWLMGGMGERGSRAFLASGNATIVQGVGDHSPPAPANDARFPLNLGISIDSDVAMSDEYAMWRPPEVVA
jgi:glycoside hydrolase-like protein